MKNPSTPTNSSKLADKLRAKVQEDQALIDDLIRQQQNAIENALRQSSNDVQRSIEENMADLNRRIRRALTLRWMPALIVGLSLFIGISAGAWGLTRYLANQIGQLLTERDALGAAVQALEQQSHGLKMGRGPDGRLYLILPPGSESGLQCGGNECVRLPPSSR
ncbi:hypothetical protein MIN45_PP22 (plasmid) [Methylomarinovum tepidoasis]|uniref:Mobilization protein n=1 Tax=Methylomarinovum tepidoasis TaxID=2840183 RepID=A0AAU9CI84_9GAMM|nr:hypothetical protein MIN45_PP22 [Methylomarinovum sp. IN45]